MRIIHWLTYWQLFKIRIKKIALIVIKIFTSVDGIVVVCWVTWGIVVVCNVVDIVNSGKVTGNVAGEVIGDVISSNTSSINSVEIDEFSQLLPYWIRKIHLFIWNYKNKITNQRIQSHNCI